MAAPAVGKAALVLLQNKYVRLVVALVAGLVLLMLVAPVVLLGLVVSTVAAATPPEDVFGGGGGWLVVGDWGHPLGGEYQWTTYADHAGGAVDFPVPEGTPVYAAATGKVWDLSESCGGIVLGVQSIAVYTPVVAHLSRATVSHGANVKAGDLIGYSGSSGSCVRGAHLHFEMRASRSPETWGEFVPVYAFMLKRGIDLGPCTEGCSLYPTS